MPPRPVLRTRLFLPFLILTCLAIPVVAAATPRDGRPVAVFAWSSGGGGAAAIAARADGELRSAGRNTRIVIASSTAPDFVARLYGAGALLVVDATMAAACLSPFVSL